ncbi:tetratricopeptide repeat protein [Amycolatopsis sp. NPDC051045]|uniref:ATP-binding protein n=1 Tax=Amycolatopsis sp. NPDC051045 TaxID=3156922 RepID=UPI0034418B9B
MSHNEFVGSSFGPLIQAGHIDQVVLGAEVPIALAGLPPTDTGFTGRSAEIAALATCVGATTASSRVTVVTGPAGIGKTTLALQAARSAVDAGEFPGGVLFVDLHGYDARRRVDPGTALEPLLRALGVAGERVPPDLASRALLFRSLLAERPGRALVVLDNAFSAGQVKELLPGDVRHRVLVTSRHTLSDLPGARQLDVGPLSAEEAVALVAGLLASAHPGDDRIDEAGGAASDLARFCGCFPLALAIAAAILVNDREQTIATLARTLADRAERLNELSTGSERSLRATIDLSYELLESRDARTFRLLTVNPGPRTSVAAAARLTGLTDREARRSLAILLSAHMIQRAGRDTFQFHDLIRLYAEERLSRDETDEARDGTIQRFLAYYHDAVFEAVMHTQAESLAEHVRPLTAGLFATSAEFFEWFDRERPNLIPAVALAAQIGRNDIAGSLGGRLYHFLGLRGSWNDAINALRFAVDAAQERSDKVEQGIALSGIGECHLAMRRFDDAVAYGEEALKVLRATKHREGIAAALQALATTYTRAGNPNRALELLDEATRLAERPSLPSVDVLLALSVAGSKAVTLFAQKRYEESIEQLQIVLAGFRQVGARKDEGIALNNIGDAYYWLERYDEAIKYYLESIVVARIAGNLRGEGATENSLGNAYFATRQNDLAMARYRQALAIARELGDRYEEAQALNNFGGALARAERFEEARASWRRAIALLDKTDNSRLLSTVVRRLDELGENCQD